MKNIMVTTENKGVFLAQVSVEKDLTPKTLTDLKNCRMVIKWRSRQGVQGMAAFGPTSECKLSAMTDIPVLHNITGVFDVTNEAAAKIWSNGKDD